MAWDHRQPLTRGGEGTVPVSGVAAQKTKSLALAVAKPLGAPAWEGPHAGG